MQTSYIENCTTNGSDMGKIRNISQQNGSIQQSVEICLTSHCLPIALTLSVISIVGMVTNLIVIVAIARDRKLHHPTFVVICSLAVADLVFLCARYPRYIIKGFFIQDIPHEHYINIKWILDIVGLLAGGASIIHIVFMSAVRYFIVVHPFTSHVMLTNKRVVLMSVGMWMLASGIAALYTYAILINGEKDPKLQEITNIVITVFMSILPIVVITIFHLLKAKVLLKSVSNCSKTVQNMSRVVTFVIVTFIITTTPSNATDVMILSFGYYYTQSRWFFVVSQVARAFLFLNFAINPFIYFVQSPQLQKSILKCCGKQHRHIESYSHQHGSLTLTSSILSKPHDESVGIKLQSCKHVQL